MVIGETELTHRPITGEDALAATNDHRVDHEAKLVDHAHLADDLNGLAADLGHLPLALAQAVTYMLDRTLPASRYRARLADTRRTLEGLVPEPGSLPDDHQATLAATWTLSADRKTLTVVAKGVDPQKVAYTSTQIFQKQ